MSPLSTTSFLYVLYALPHHHVQFLLSSPPFVFPSLPLFKYESRERKERVTREGNGKKESGRNRSEGNRERRQVKGKLDLPPLNVTSRGILCDVNNSLIVHREGIRPRTPIRPRHAASNAPSFPLPLSLFSPTC